MLMILRSFEKVPKVPILENCHSNRGITSVDSEIKGAITKIAKINTIIKLPVNKLFTVENTYQDTNQRDKAIEQKLRREAAVIGEIKRKYECQREHLEGESL